MFKKFFIFLITIFIVVVVFLIFNFKKTEKLKAQTTTNFIKAVGGIDTDLGFSVTQTNDEGYIVTGRTYNWGAGYDDVLLMKFDSGSDLSWTKVIGGAGRDYGRSVIQTTDGGYIIAGAGTGGAGGWDVLLSKFDSNGNLSWVKLFGESNDEYAQSMTPTTDGGYIVVGRTMSWGPSNWNILLMKFDSSDNLTWTQMIGKGGTDLAFSIIQTTDGGYILAGSSDSWGAGLYDALIMKFDSDGNYSWAKAVGTTSWDGARSISQTTDGGYIAAGYTFMGSGTGYYDVALMKFDSTGNLSWAKAIGGAWDDYAQSISQTTDGGYIVAGYTESFGSGDEDVLLMKFDLNNNLSWTKVISVGTLREDSFSISQTSDGGYVLTGVTESRGAGDLDVLLLKTDVNGDILDCPLVTSTSPIITTPTRGVEDPPPPPPSIQFVSPVITTPSLDINTPTPNIDNCCLAAPSTYNVSSWAWSENIGWISFNCTNRNWCATSSYGVNIDPVTGYFSGYAWSDNIGWITFNETDLSSCPISPCRAWVDLLCPGGQCPVYGWARIVAYNGDWPGGWIRLRDTNYGVWIDPSLTPAQFKGWAWSDFNIGWISFNCLNEGVCGTSDYKVITTLSFNSPPYVELVQLDGTPIYCNIMPGRGRVGLKWTYQDNEGDNQTEYHLQVATDAGFSNLVVDTTSSQIVLPGGIGTAAVWTVPTPTPETNDFDISYGGSYYWQVRVKAATGNQDWSNWEEGPNFTTPLHAYPWPDFAPRPSKPSIGEIVTFIQDGSDLNNTEALCYSGGVSLCQNKGIVSYEWDFDFNINPGTDSIYVGNATTTYTSITNYDVILTITNDVGFCSQSKTLNLSLPLPKWKEIPPG